MDIVVKSKMDIGFTFFLHCLIHAFIFATCRWSECSAVRCAATLSLRSPHAGRQHHCNLTFMKSCQASSRIYKHINGNLPQWLKLNYVSHASLLVQPTSYALHDYNYTTTNILELLLLCTMWSTRHTIPQALPLAKCCRLFSLPS